MNDKNHSIVTKEVILKQGKRHGSAETFVYEPSNMEEEPLGNLYIIGKTAGRDKELGFIPNLIASLMRREFYKPGDESTEIRFESGLKKANAALLDIEAANTAATDDIELGIINIAQDKIRLSQIGNLAALLYRGNEMIDLKQTSDKKKKKEFFSSVVAGDIMQNDKLIFSTEKIIDLFSDEGLKKLGALDTNRQADIISRLYQKNCQNAPLPDQAAILLDIQEYKISRSASLRKRIAAAPPAKKYFTGAIKTRLSKKGKMVVAGLLFSIAALTVYLPIQNKFSATRDVAEQIKKAGETSVTDKKSAIAILEDARRSAAPLLSTWYLSETAKKLSGDIDTKINELNGIYKKTPAEWAKLDIEAIKFSPRYIFDGGDNIYVFGSPTDMAYKIRKQDKSSTFTPLHIENKFIAERSIEESGYLYLVNSAEKSAYIFYPETEETAPVLKSLKRILALPADYNFKTSENADYRLNGQNEIIKTTKNDKLQQTFVINQSDPIIDFAASKDEKIIYLLTQNKILSIESQ